MKCPFCGYEESKVIDSRPTDEGERIRRRRECLKCGKRFTTYEIIESVPILVIKKDKSREAFDRNKLLNGMMRACEKRPVAMDTLERPSMKSKPHCKIRWTARLRPCVSASLQWTSSKILTRLLMSGLRPFTGISGISTLLWTSFLRFCRTVD